MPDGAFSRADDVVVRRPGYVETRRGFKPAPGAVSATGTDRILSFSDYAGTLIAHTSANKLARPGLSSGKNTPSSSVSSGVLRRRK